MKILTFGARSQLARSIERLAPEYGDSTFKFDSDVDITDRASVCRTVREGRPDVIFNCAAYTAVDKAESDVEAATAVNVFGAENVAIAAAEYDSRLVHISTDFVFDGAATKPYGVDHPTNPLGVYGRTKRDGELAVLSVAPRSAVIIRTAWLYSRYPKNFATTMLRLMKEKSEISVVDDQIGTPTWTESLARAMLSFAALPHTKGLYHWTDGGEATWYQFATMIRKYALEARILTNKIPIRPIRTEDYPTAAKRPAYSVLDLTETIKVTGIRPQPWSQCLKLMLKGYKAQ